ANVEALRMRLDEYARRCLSVDDFDPVLEADADLSLTEITPELFAAIEQLEPFGAANYAPVFVARGVRLMAPAKLIKDKHVRLRMAERFQQDGMIAGDSFDVAFTLEQNDHPEFGGIELTLRDFKRDVAGAKSASIP